jgi:hypothetical protein
MLHTSKYFALALPMAKLKARITLERDKNIVRGLIPQEIRTTQKTMK